MVNKFSRRGFLRYGSLAGLGTILPFYMPVSESDKPDTTSSVMHEPIIDIHQHIGDHGRTHKQLLAHQRNMGINQTILLPAGSSVNRASTHFGDANGLAVGAGGNNECFEFAQKYPEEFFIGANEVPDLPNATKEIEKYLEQGAVVVGELKFGLACDSPDMQKIYELAQSYDVPVLIHWQYHMYNYGFDRFYKMLEKYPKVNFIGHAQTWWGNVDKNYKDQTTMYPKGKIKPGGLTDRLLSEYPNMYGDLSANSGLNALTRDEDFTRDFLERHQDKLLFGSDCPCTSGGGKSCNGTQIIAAVQKLSSNKKIERKILFENAKKMFKI